MQPAGRRESRNSLLVLANLNLRPEFKTFLSERIEGRQWGLDAAIEGAADRLTPILMTSIVTGLGVLPLAIGMGDPRREVEGPMAIVILGGLRSSMSLNLLVLPTLALRYGRFERSDDEI